MGLHRFRAHAVVQRVTERRVAHAADDAGPVLYHNELMVHRLVRGAFCSWRMRRIEHRLVQRPFDEVWAAERGMVSHRPTSPPTLRTPPARRWQPQHLP